MALATLFLASQHPPSLDRWMTRTPTQALTVATTISGQPVPDRYTGNPGIRAFTEAKAPPTLDFHAPCGPQRWCAPDPPKVRRKAATGQRGRSGGTAVDRGYDITPSVAYWERLHRCEQGNSWTVDGRFGNGMRGGGGLGLSNAAWNAWGGLEFASRPGLATPEQQMIVASRGFRRYGQKPWGCKPSL